LGSPATPARAGGGFVLAVGDLKLNTCILGGCIGTVDAVLGAAVTPLLNTVLGLLNPLISGLLAGLGVHLGYVDVTVPGVRCGQAVLVE
ncbi:MAG: hypothetical protein ABW063_08740, partial [Caulobacter sp.]